MTLFFKQVLFATILASSFCCQYSFAYDSNKVFYFSQEGEIKTSSRSDNIPRIQKNPPRCSRKIANDGSFEIRHSEKIFSAPPGDYIFPVMEDENSIWLLSEKNCNFAQIVKWQPDNDKVQNFSITGNEFVGTVTDGKKIYALVYGSVRLEYIFFDNSMEQLQKKILRENKNAVNVVWDEHSPIDDKWLARIIFIDRFDSVILADLRSNTYSILSESKKISKAEKFIANYIASDGEIINSIVTLPPNASKKLPLVVFPHGGPGTVTMLAYDYRVDFLVSRGFAVFQPNYRGSRGFGKKFRQQGWRTMGIKRQLLDVIEGVKYIKNKPYIDKSRCYILGGSWAGYLTMALLTLENSLFDAGVSLFGSYNLVSMLTSFPEKSGANTALDKLQLGDVNNRTDVEELKKLSPLFNLQKLTTPVLVIHFKDDNVIEFDQAAALQQQAEKLQLKNIFFITAPGEHGFENIAAEEKFYDKIVDFFNRHP